MRRDCHLDRACPPGPLDRRGRVTHLLPVIERVSGSEHPDTLAVRDSLALWTRRACRQVRGK
jgi:hypothetical protein